MNIRDIRSQWATAKRQVMVRCLSGVLPLYVVNEYPKSGGSWFGEMLGAALGVPFPRNCIPPLRPCIMHGHYLTATGMRNVVTVWRDGRDVLTSYYYHCYFNNDRYNSRFVTMMRDFLPFADYEDVPNNLPVFLETMLTRPLYPSFTWQEFVKRWLTRDGVSSVRYEALLADAAVELARVIQELGLDMPSAAELTAIVDANSFKRMGGRNRGMESRNSFLRKGVAGDWKNYFTAEASEVFDYYAGSQLIALGYERDHDWVRKRNYGA